MVTFTANIYTPLDRGMILLRLFTGSFCDRRALWEVLSLHLIFAINVSTNLCVVFVSCKLSFYTATALYISRLVLVLLAV